MTIRRLIGGAGLGLALVLTACGSEDVSPTAVNAPSAVATNSTAGGGVTDMQTGSGTGNGSGSDATDATATAMEGADQATTIAISADPSGSRFSQGVMSAPAGSKLAINFNNPSNKPHTWVLVQAGKEQAVADAAAAKGGNAQNIDGVIAWSEVVTNSTVTINVPPLKTGGYTYLSTMPGDYPQMKGALNVR